LKIFLKNHKNTFFTCILLFVFLISLQGCSRKPGSVFLSIPEKYKKNWDLIIKTYPLPDSLQFVDTNYENLSIPEIKIIPCKNRGNLSSDYIVLLEKTYFVPITDFWDTVTDIDISDISNYKLLPVKDLQLPKKGLSVNRLYPEDTGYPLFEEKLLTLFFPEDFTDTNNTTEVLTNWFAEIKTAFDQSDYPLPDITWIAGVGDIMVQRGIETILINRDRGLEYIFGNTLNILRNQNLMLGNLEGSITYTSTKTPKSYNFKFNPKVLSFLKKAGFDYFSITNNHIYDYGETGFKDTLEYLEKAGIPTSGAGLTRKEASEYTEFVIDNNVFRILSLGAYPQEKNGWDGRTMAQVTDTRPGILFEGDLVMEAVKNMTSSSSFDILMIHGGEEWNSNPNDNQIDLYRSYIESGVDLIFGSHPHVLQGLEVWNDKLISYSLGNFIFPGMGSVRFAEESMILSVGIVDNTIKYLKPIPVKIDNQKLSIDSSGNISERFKNLCIDLIGSN